MGVRRGFRTSSLLLFAAGAMLVAGLFYGSPYVSEVLASSGSRQPEQANAPQPVSGSQGSQLLRKQTELEDREAQVREREEQIRAAERAQAQQQDRQVRIRQVVELYTAMPPSRAATLMGSLDDETAVEVLQKLDFDHAAAILIYLNAERGALLMAEILKPPATPAP